MTDFNEIIKLLQDHPGSTTREIVAHLKKRGFATDKHVVNSALYRMIKQGLVKKDESNVPKWTYSSANSFGLPKEVNQNINFKTSKTIFSQSNREISEFIHEKDFKIILDDIQITFAYDLTVSPNDPYLIADWLNEHLFISLNCQHPFWKTFISNEEMKEFFLVFTAQDALLQWTAAKRGDTINSSSMNSLRDEILRKIAHSRSTD